MKDRHPCEADKAGHFKIAHVPTTIGDRQRSANFTIGNSIGDRFRSATDFEKNTRKVTIEEMKGNLCLDKVVSDARPHRVRFETYSS